jgi:formylglycine-generating enzyme required for sulfatase activity
VGSNEIEGHSDPGVHVQYEWEEFPIRFHKHIINIKKFFIDKTSVTNKQFEKFLNATKYSPIDAHNFLRDWENGQYREGWADKPVTWVS